MDEETRDLETRPAHTHESHPAGVEEAPPPQPDRIGRYRIVGTLGKGGMGVVYDAHDETLDRPVALKLLLADNAGLSGARLQREAQALAQLSHENVVQVYETGMHRGRLFIAMERVEGMTLRSWLARSKRSVDEVAPIITAAGRGLAAAHAVGLIHRDFKPGNVLVGSDGRVRVVDFGLARSSELGSGDTDGVTPFPSVSGSHSAAVLTELTETGVLMGTPAYMAPEMLERGEATMSTDQFALCVTAYEAWYGQRPFSGRTVRQLASALREGLPAPPLDTTVPTSIHRVLARGLAYDPDDRYPSIDALLTALQHHGRRRRRLRWPLALGAVAALGVGSIFVPSKVGPCDSPEGDLGAVWSSDQKTAMVSAFEGTALPYAATASAGVAAELDRFSQQWASTRSELCEAWGGGHISSRTFDVRLACLSAGKRSLSELVALLSEGDPGIVEHAIDLTLSSLSPPDACMDVAADDGPAPATPEAEAAHQRHLARLARIRLLRGGLQTERAMTEVDLGSADAQSTGLPQPSIELSLERGRLQVQAGDYEAAAETLERSYFAAREAGVDALAHDTAAALANLLVVQRDQPDEGEAWVEHAMATSLPEGRAEVNAWEARIRGSIADKRGNYEEAQALYEVSLQLVEERHGTEHGKLIRPLNDLINVLQRRGQFEQALRYSERAQTLARANLGDQHPMVAQILLNTGGVHVGQGHFDEARSLLEQALTILDATRGKDHPDMIPVLSNLALCDFQRGDFDRASTYLERVIELGTRVHGEHHIVVAGARMHRGNIDFQGGNYESAVRRFTRAIGSMEITMGPEHPALNVPLSNMAQALSQLGRHDEARRHGQRAHELP